MKKRLFAILFFLQIWSFSIDAQTDTTAKRQFYPAKSMAMPATKAERISTVSDQSILVFGDYEVTGYSILSTETLAAEELQALLGTVVKVQENSITGVAIDPMSFDIYEIERLRRDDFIFRVFGRQVRGPEPDLPESFNVHKTDNENCYGIAVTGSGQIAIPYKGVLLYLRRK